MFYSEFVDEIRRLVEVLTSADIALKAKQIWIAGPAAQGWPEPMEMSVIAVPEYWCHPEDTDHVKFAEALGSARRLIVGLRMRVRVYWVPYVLAYYWPGDYRKSLQIWSKEDPDWVGKIAAIKIKRGSGPKIAKLGWLVPPDVWRFTDDCYNLLEESPGDGSLILDKASSIWMRPPPTARQQALLNDRAFMRRFFEPSYVVSSALQFMDSLLPSSKKDDVLWYEPMRMSSADGSLKLYYGCLEIRRLFYELADGVLQRWIGYPASSAADQQIYVFRRGVPESRGSLARFRNRLRRLDRMDDGP